MLGEKGILSGNMTLILGNGSHFKGKKNWIFTVFVLYMYMHACVIACIQACWHHACVHACMHTNRHTNDRGFPKKPSLCSFNRLLHKTTIWCRAYPWLSITNHWWPCSVYSFVGVFVKLLYSETCGLWKHIHVSTMPCFFRSNISLLPRPVFIYPDGSMLWAPSIHPASINFLQP